MALGTLEAGSGSGLIQSLTLQNERWERDPSYRAPEEVPESEAVAMSSHAELRARAAATYNSAANSNDASANTFWERFGRSTIPRLELSPRYARPRCLCRHWSVGDSGC